MPWVKNNLHDFYNRACDHILHYKQCLIKFCLQKDLLDNSIVAWKGFPFSTTTLKLFMDEHFLTVWTLNLIFGNRIWEQPQPRHMWWNDMAEWHARRLLCHMVLKYQFIMLTHHYWPSWTNTKLVHFHSSHIVG